MVVANKFLQKADEHLAPYLVSLDEYIEKNHFLNKHLSQLETKTKVEKKYLAAGALFIGILYLIFGSFGGLVCNLIGFVQPAYQSVKAIESITKEDDTKWLTYWVVFAFFMVVESFIDLILFWFPFYWLAKCALLMWLANYGGAVLVYDKFLRHFVNRHVKKIDEVVQNGVDGFIGQASAAMDKASEINNEFKTE